MSDNPWATPGWPNDGDWDSPVAAPEQDVTPDSVSDHQDPNVAAEDWGAAWSAPPADHTESQPPDKWEAARQEKEKLNRAVPPEFLDALLRHCHQVSQEIWPPSDPGNEDSWRSGFDNLADSAALLAQLVPPDSTLPQTVQFSATATAKAMNEALKLTRHLPSSASSPLSRLLASKGSLDWEKSIKAKQDSVPDTAHVGWRVLEKEDRVNPVEESKSKKATGGLLSFWSRRASAIQGAPVETPSERARSPARSSLENAKSLPHPSSSRAASPKASTPSAPLPPPPDTHPMVVATAPAPSAVSRFLNRFSRAKSTQHSSLALSSDDLEFLSDIVPSAIDPPDEDIDNTLTGAGNSSPLPPKLPPPIPPPPKQSSRPSSALGLGTLDSVSGSTPIGFQTQGVHQTSNVPVLAPPLSPKTATPFSRTQSPSLSDATIDFGQPSAPSMQPGLQLGSQPNSRPRSPFILPPPQKVPALLSLPPLLPPPPVSPPQTPRPGAFASIMVPAPSSVMPSTDTSLLHDTHDSDDEFSAFESFPPSAPTPFPSLDLYPSQRSPTPPSPPPRRKYERTHYPSSSSTSSILSPASQTSVDQLCSTKSFISASLDSFDDFVPSPSVAQAENKKLARSPPPLPNKSHSQHRQPPPLDTLPSRVHHAHTSSQAFASPTAHTSLLHNAFSGPSVSDAEHRRTQSLVDHAAANGGLLWPNSPEASESKVNAIPPPPPSSTSPRSLIEEESFDLLGDGDGFGALPAPSSGFGGVGMGSTALFSATGGPLGAVGPGKGRGSRNPLQPSSPPILLFSSPGTALHSTVTNAGTLQPAKPKQTGGLSAQDLSFFEGL